MTSSWCPFCWALYRTLSLSLFPHWTSSPQPKKYCGTETRLVWPLPPFHLPLASFIQLIPFISCLIYVPRAEAVGCLRFWAAPGATRGAIPAQPSLQLPALPPRLGTPGWGHQAGDHESPRPVFLCNHQEAPTFPFSPNINWLHMTVGNALKFYEAIKTAGYFYYISLNMPSPTFILIQKWPDIPPVRIITSHSMFWFHVAGLICDFQIFLRV